jgi:hypothetical protein
LSRPTGIAVAAIVEILLGIFALIGGIVHLLFGVGGLVTFSGTDVTLGNLANALGDLFTVEGLILLVAGAGLWQMKKWGWQLSVAIVVAGLVTSVPVLYLGSVGAIPAIIVNLALLFYLLRGGTRRLFNPSGQGQPSAN